MLTESLGPYKRGGTRHRADYAYSILGNDFGLFINRYNYDRGGERIRLEKPSKELLMLSTMAKPSRRRLMNSAL